MSLQVQDIFDAHGPPADLLVDFHEQRPGMLDALSALVGSIRLPQDENDLAAVGPPSGKAAKSLDDDVTVATAVDTEYIDDDDASIASDDDASITTASSCPIVQGLISNLAAVKADDLAAVGPPPCLSHTGDKRAKNKKKVRFFPQTEINFIARHDDPTEFWCSSQEYNSMKVQNVIAVTDMRVRYSSTSMKDQQKLEMHGLENLLTQKLIKARVLCRKELVRSIMDEQDVQWDSDKDDAEKFAEISRHFSEWTVKRAKLIGMMQVQKEQHKTNNTK